MFIQILLKTICSAYEIDTKINYFNLERKILVLEYVVYTDFS